MSMNDDPRGFRRGPPASREFSQQQQQQQQRSQPQQPRDRYDQYPPRADARPPRPQPPQMPPQAEKSQASFSAYKPEAYAKPEGPGGNQTEWDHTPPQRQSRPAPPRADMAPPMPPRPDQRPADPYSMPADLPSDPYYQPAASDPYASHSGDDFDNDWGRDSFNDAGASQFQNFYAQDEQTAFDGDAQSTHDEFFAPSDHGHEELPPLPVAPSLRDALPRAASPFDEQGYDTGRAPNYDQGHDDHYSEPLGNPYAADVDSYGAEPVQRHRGVQQQSTGFDDQNNYGWDEFEQAPPPAPAAARPFHPPAVRDEDIDADFFADEDDYDIDDYENGGGKKKLVAAVLAGALIVGGGGAYLYSNGNGNFASGPSIIAADSSPIKEEPADPGGREFPNGNKLIYDRLGGEAPSGERLASAEVASTASAESIPGIVTTGGSGTLEERIENALRAQGGGADAKSPDAPRTVQTLTFSPDGSQQPVRPQTQSIGVDSGSNDALSSAIVVSGQPSGSAGNYGTTVSPPAVETNSVNAVPAQNVQAEETQVASIAPQAETASISTGVGGTDNYFVQIGARNDPQAATEAFKKLQQRYASVIGNYSPSLRKADLGAKGVWYRLWVGPVDDKVEAEALCEQLKLAGMKACLVRKDQ